MLQSDENSPLTLIELSQGRALTYQWLSQQFQAELSQQQWQALANGQLDSFFQFLTESGLGAEVKAYLFAVQELAAHAGAEAHIVLRSDFAHAFLLSAKQSALPYAAAYDADAKGMLYGVTAEVMRQYLQQTGLALSKDFKEPEDHLSIYLAVLSHMAGQVTEDNATSTLEAQRLFIVEALEPWLAQFVVSCEQVPLQTTVYSALAKLLAAFVAQDLEYLKSASTVVV